MPESVMRQELETWLKRECVNAGNSMIYALTDIEDALDRVHSLDRPERFHTASSNIISLTRMAISHISNLPLELLTAEERRDIFELGEEIEEGLKGKILTENIKWKLLGLSDLTKKYLLEKVAECQCGKPPIAPGKWTIYAENNIDDLFDKGLITEDEKFYLLLEFRRGGLFTIQNGKITRGE